MVIWEGLYIVRIECDEGWSAGLTQTSYPHIRIDEFYDIYVCQGCVLVFAV